MNYKSACPKAFDLLETLLGRSPNYVSHRVMEHIEEALMVDSTPLSLSKLLAPQAPKLSI